MEPRIQYARTADGVSIAFWTLGEGTPLVEMPAMPLSNIQMEWQIPEVRRWYERLSEKIKLVRYDCRGAGLSDRDVTDYSFEAQVLDLEAVVDRPPLWPAPGPAFVRGCACRRVAGIPTERVAATCPGQIGKNLSWQRGSFLFVMSYNVICRVARP